MTAKDESEQSRQKTIQPMTTKGGPTRSPPAPSAQQRRRQPRVFIDPDDNSKIRAGKANVKRDLGIFVAFIALIFTASLSIFRDIGRAENYTDSDLGLIEKNKKPIVECHLYLASSSIPGVKGFGVFAGKAMKEGDIVFGSGLSIPNMLNLTQHQLLLKHHPLLANVKSIPSSSVELSATEEKFQFRASTAIQPGEEILVQYQEHHTLPVFADVPLNDDYLLADEIVKDQMQFHIKQNRARRRDTASYGAMLKHTQRVVSKVNPKVSLLLPTTTDMLKKAKSTRNSTALLSMRHRSIYWLAEHGQCLDNVKVSEKDGTHSGLFASRSIEKHSVVIPVPLYVSEDEGSGGDTSGEFCEDGDETAKIPQPMSSCYGHADSSLIFCPLSAAVFIGHKSVSDDDGPNARYEWSKENKANVVARGLPAEAVLKDHSLSLSFDIVALRNISIGEEIVMDYRKTLNVNEGVIGVTRSHIPGEMFPAAWRRTR